MCECVIRCCVIVCEYFVYTIYIFVFKNIRERFYWTVIDSFISRSAECAQIFIFSVPATPFASPPTPDNRRVNLYKRLRRRRRVRYCNLLFLLFYYRTHKYYFRTSVCSIELQVHLQNIPKNHVCMRFPVDTSLLGVCIIYNGYKGF